MRVRRHRTFQVKVQEYESYGFGVVVERGPEDYGLTEADLAAMTPKQREKHHEKLEQDVDQALNDQLAEEIAFAKDLSNFRKSYIHSLED